MKRISAQTIHQTSSTSQMSMWASRLLARCFGPAVLSLALSGAGMAIPGMVHAQLVGDAFMRREWGHIGVFTNTAMNGSANSWVSTQSNSFTPIGGLGAVFYAEEDGTHVAVHLSADIRLSQPGSRIDLDVRVDGFGPYPGIIAGAATDGAGVVSYVFPTIVGYGQHDIQVRWRVVGGGMAEMCNASLFVQTGKPDAARGVLATAALAGGEIVLSRDWQQIGGTVVAHVGDDHERLLVIASAVGTCSAPNACETRIRIDGRAGTPSKVALAGPGDPQARTVAVISRPLSVGDHRVVLESRVRRGATGHLSDVAVAASWMDGSSRRSWAFNGTNARVARLIADEASWQAVPRLSREMTIPANAEMAITTSLDVLADPGDVLYLRARVFDAGNEWISSTRSVLTDSSGFGALSTTFGLNGINQTGQTAPVTVVIEMKASGAREFTLGPRSFVALAEVGDLPDLTGGMKLADLADHGDWALRRGTIPLLTIVASQNTMAPPRLNLPAGAMADIADRLFGPHSLADYFEEVSGRAGTSNGRGRFTFSNAGILGPYQPDYTYPDGCTDPDGSEIAWEETICEDPGPDPSKPKKCACESPCSEGHVSYGRKAWIKLLGQADADIDFSQFDRNRDGTVDSTELAIVIFAPEDVDHGVTRALRFCSNAPNGEDVVFDGVVLKEASSWTKNPSTAFDPLEFDVVAHELGHQVLGFQDLYVEAVAHDFEPNRYSLMALHSQASHLDAAQKIMLGWAKPRLISETATIVLHHTKVNGEVLVLPRLDGKGSEYFLLELRAPANAMAIATYDRTSGESGVAIWHVIDPAGERSLDLRDAEPRCYVDNEWDEVNRDARRAIRLVRPSVIQSNNELWTPDDGEVLDRWSPAQSMDPLLCGEAGASGAGDDQWGVPALLWADMTPSGYHVEVVSISADAPPVAEVRITVDRSPPP